MLPSGQARLFTWYFFLRGFVLLFFVWSMSQLEGIPRTPYTGLSSSFLQLPLFCTLSTSSSSYLGEVKCFLLFSFTYYRVSLSVKVLPFSFHSTSWGVGEVSFWAQCIDVPQGSARHLMSLHHLMGKRQGADSIIGNCFFSCVPSFLQACFLLHEWVYFWNYWNISVIIFFNCRILCLFGFLMVVVSLTNFLFCSSIVLLISFKHIAYVVL